MSQEQREALVDRAFVVFNDTRRDYLLPGMPHDAQDYEEAEREGIAAVLQLASREVQES